MVDTQKLQCEKLMRDIHNDFMEIFIYESYINEFYRQNDKEGAEVIEEKITDEAQPIPAVNDKEGAEVIKEKIMDATQPIPAVIEQENDITQGEKIEETQEEPRSAPAGVCNVCVFSRLLVHYRRDWRDFKFAL
ncbi:uncharacterized protein LOC130048112 [Ostrea edulis]|uniref:uncharacterized protein LOC130048112 n=1 Tax=Ostrea edulis TaxID=37623 RepID=UPI0024AEFCA7|nr:uncharacterized protein LOC130048112 [Ostrea edulis]